MNADEEIHSKKRRGKKFSNLNSLNDNCQHATNRKHNVGWLSKLNKPNFEIR